MAKQYNVLTRQYEDIPDSSGAISSINRVLASPQSPRVGVQNANKPIYSGSFSGSSKNQSINDLISSIYGGAGSREPYTNVVSQGYEILGQPRLTSDDPRGQVANNFVSDIASIFADNFYKKTGRLPTQEQLTSFVTDNADPYTAQKYIQGTIGRDSISRQADDYFKGNPDFLVDPGAKSEEEQRLAGLTDQLNKAYEAGKQNFTTQYGNEVYNPARTQAINDLAAQGLLRNANSRYLLNEIEGNKSRDISSGLNTLEGNRALGQIDIAKTIEDLIQQNKNRNQSAYQFGQNLALTKNQYADQQALQRRQLDLSSQLGRLQANANKKGALDYLGTAFGGLGALGSLATGIGNFRSS